MVCIYTIRSASSPSKFYIGSAVDFRVRKNSHLSYLRRNKHHNPILQNHFNKYGEDDLIFDVTEVVEDVNNLLAREQHHINITNPFFNVCKVAGTSLGTKRTPESIERMRLAKIGNKHNLGRKLSKEHKAKISAANSGRKKSDSHKQKMIVMLKRTAEVRNKKISETLKGSSMPDDVKHRISLSLRGDKNHKWKGGISNTYLSNIKNNYGDASFNRS